MDGRGAGADDGDLSGGHCQGLGKRMCWAGAGCKENGYLDSCAEERKRDLEMGQVEGARWSERSEVTHRSLDCIFCGTGCHDQVAGGNQGEGAGLEERRGKGVPGGKHSWAVMGEGSACSGESEKSSLAGVEGSACRGEEDGRKGRIRGLGHQLTPPGFCSLSLESWAMGRAAVKPHWESSP